ncbi:hypothetical protein [Paenibacillus silvisoli]|uniref:hypothetical protein n=1 Tax=Paenibacillus silvisoli TaxID=3110539 RepID=UPI0028046F7B|nr:hypothetical protein [Paenibacillus silvisoli]
MAADTRTDQAEPILPELQANVDKIKAAFGNSSDVVIERLGVSQDCPLEIGYIVRSQARICPLNIGQMSRRRFKSAFTTFLKAKPSIVQMLGFLMSPNNPHL